MDWFSGSLKGFWDRVLRTSVRYGYFPERALMWGLALIAVTWVWVLLVWSMGDMTPTAAPVLMSADWQAIAQLEARPGDVWAARHGPGQDYQTLSTFWYAADLVVPLINFGQGDAWGPSTSRSGWGVVAHYAWPVLKVLGWVITALGAAAVTGTIRRE